MTNVPGVLGTQGRLIPGMTASEIEVLFSESAIGGGMLPKFGAALAAVRSGVKTAHIIDGRVPNALLLEVLTSERAGTAICSNAGPHFHADTRLYFSASEPAS